VYKARCTSGAPLLSYKQNPIFQKQTNIEKYAFSLVKCIDDMHIMGRVSFRCLGFDEEMREKLFLHFSFFFPNEIVLGPFDLRITPPFTSVSGNFLVA